MFDEIEDIIDSLSIGNQRERKQMTPEQQQYYSVNIRLKPEDKKALDKLRDKGKTIVEVLRKGIEVMSGKKKK